MSGTKIGFKPTQEVKDTLTRNNVQIEKLDVLIKIASKIDAEMQEMATGFVKHETFSKFNAKTINDYLDKIYTKYYEPI